MVNSNCEISDFAGENAVIKVSHIHKFIDGFVIPIAVDEDKSSYLAVFVLSVKV
jgi:hypothetical protein